jgi:hypothetical protein
MSFYKELIIEATNCTEAEAWEIEDVMRNDIFHSTLDWQTKGQLKKAAREGHEVVKYMKTDEYKKQVEQFNAEWS